MGFGAGRGFRYLSAGSIVRSSELVELTLAFRCLRWPLLKYIGTFSTFMVCPGSIGQDVVDGSAGLWYSVSSSSWYWFRYQSRAFPASYENFIHNTNICLPFSTLLVVCLTLVHRCRHRLCSRSCSNQSSAQHHVVYLSSWDTPWRNCPTSRAIRPIA